MPVGGFSRLRSRWGGQHSQGPGCIQAYGALQQMEASRLPPTRPTGQQSSSTGADASAGLLGGAGGRMTLTHQALHRGSPRPPHHPPFQEAQAPQATGNRQPHRWRRVR